MAASRSFETSPSGSATLDYSATRSRENGGAKAFCIEAHRCGCARGQGPQVRGGAKPVDCVLGGRLHHVRPAFQGCQRRPHRVVVPVRDDAGAGSRFSGQWVAMIRGRRICMVAGERRSSRGPGGRRPMILAVWSLQRREPPVSCPELMRPSQIQLRAVG